MSTTVNDIRRWWNARPEQTTHMIVVCDTFDHTDYPVYVGPNENVRERAKEYDGRNMQRIMEVYSASFEFEPQLTPRRVLNYN